MIEIYSRFRFSVINFQNVHMNTALTAAESTERPVC